MVILAVAAPAVAAPADYGSTARCRYEITAEGPFGWTEADLTRIRVTPPEMYAQSGTQTVGWGFLVRRSMNRDNGPWRVVRRSRIQMASATTTSPAAFSLMRTGVTVPDIDEPEFVHYYVVLKMFWFNGDGSIASKVSYPMSDIELNVEGTVPHPDGAPYCPGRLTQQT
jgi:hypothetical protein